MPTTTVETGTELKAKLFRGLSDSSRLSILEVLLQDKTSVGEIVEQTGLSQPNVSSHLRCLSDCGLVVSKRDGRRMLYQISDPRIRQLIQFTEELLADAAKGVYECTRYE